MRIVRGFSLLTTLLFATGSLAEGQITHGPILGRLSSDGVGVWVRTSRPGPFRVVYGESSSPKGQTTAPVDTQLARDNTGWVHITGLKPNTKYFYRVATGSENKASGGSFRTLPRAATYRDPELNPRGVFNFSFEFGCGNAQRPGHGGGYNAPAFKTMFEKLKDKVHFSIQNGDWLYEDSRSYSPEQWSRQVGVSASQVPGILRIAPTLAGVWENYKVYLDRGRNLAHYHRNVPTFFTFDDHEILNDVWGAGSPGLRDRRAIFRDIGVQAWYDYLGWSNPVDFAQGIHFGRAELKAESDVLTDKKANFTELDLEQAATLHVHWGGPTAGVNDNALDGVGGARTRVSTRSSRSSIGTGCAFVLLRSRMARRLIRSDAVPTITSGSATRNSSSPTRGRTAKCTTSDSPTSPAFPCSALVSGSGCLTGCAPAKRTSCSWSPA